MDHGHAVSRAVTRAMRKERSRIALQVRVVRTYAHALLTRTIHREPWIPMPSRCERARKAAPMLGK